MNGKISRYISEHITKKPIPDIALASFNYNGVTQYLIPSRMKCESEGLFSYEIDRLRVTLELISYPEHSASDWLIRFENTSSENSGRINELRGLDLTLPVCGGIEYGSLQGDLCNGEAFLPIKRPIYACDYYSREASTGRSSATTAFPFFDICENGDSSFLCAIGWTGKWRMDIASVNGKIDINSSIADADFYLYPGEKVRGQRIVLMSGDMPPEDLRRKFVAFEREYYSPRKSHESSDFASVLTFSCFDRYYWNDPTWIGEEKQLRTVELNAKSNEANTYWFDAAWFEGCFIHGGGNYRYNSLLPNGLMPVTARAHELGLKCVLWFEPESIQNPPAVDKANIAYAPEQTDFFKEHPEWLLTQNDIPKESFHVFLADLTNPDARDYIFNNICKVLAENKIDFYRQDFNQEPSLYWSHTDKPGRRGITELHYVEGLYELWDRITERFPGIVIDNCSSGGRRLDIEMLSRSISLWRSDVSCAPATDEAQRDIWDQNINMSLGRYIPYYSGGTWYDDMYNVRSVATRGAVLQLPALEEGFNMSAATAAFSEIKRTRRYFDGKMYELTEPGTDSTLWAGYQCHLEDADEGMVRLFRRKDSERAEMTFSLKGVCAGTEYLLAIYDERNNIEEYTVTGDELIKGYTFRISDKKASLTAEYKRK